MTRKLHYLTHDQVNGQAARDIGERFGLAMEVVDLRDVPRLQASAAELLLDWDYLPVDDRDRLLENYAPVLAVIGRNLPPYASFLPRRGIIVSDTLNDTVMQKIVGWSRAA